MMHFVIFLILLILLTTRPKPVVSQDPLPFGVSSTSDPLFFQPLSCNPATLLDDDGTTTTPCESWSTFISNLDISSTIVIPCGQCVKLDVDDGSVIDLPGGLDIHGKLILASMSYFTLRLPVLLVQGILEYKSSEANKVLSPENQRIKIVMTGNDELSFTPHNENADLCIGGVNSDSCDIGSKGFIIAGGKLNIDGWYGDETCPTWVNLLDSIPRDTPITPVNPLTQPTVPEGCSSSVIISSNFDIDMDSWVSSPGTKAVLSNTMGHLESQYLHISSRKREYQGAIFDITAKSHCLLPNTPYIFTTRAMLLSQDIYPSICSSKSLDSSDGSNKCLHIRLATLLEGDDVPTYRTLYADRPSAGVLDGQWFTIQSTVEFTEEETSSPGETTTQLVYQALIVNGPEGNIDISLDDITLQIPPSTSDDSTGVCNDLIRYNGDAELNIFAYPFQPGIVENTHLSIRTSYVDQNGARYDDDPNNTLVENKYFHLTGREETFSSLEYDITSNSNNECIKPYDTYNFQSTIRVINDNVPQIAKMVLKKTNVANIEGQEGQQTNEYYLETIGTCSPSKNEWVHCMGQYTFSSSDVDDDVNLALIWVVEDDKFSDVDYDDISIAFVSGGVSTIHLPHNVINCWGVGSELVFSSSTLNYKQDVVDTIQSISAAVGGTEVVVELTNGIPRYSTTLFSSQDYAIEVGILTRNILITSEEEEAEGIGGGGHIKFLHTKAIGSQLEGVEIVGFGQMGRHGRYPINLHMSGHSTTSISRNVIRNSNHRCIVLHGTNDITVNDNICYNIYGHSYVTESGSETNNVFANNLGIGTKNVPIDQLIDVNLSSDHMSSTFYMTSPTNSWIGNVAAGSETFGFWLTYFDYVRGSAGFVNENVNLIPSSLPMKEFSNNVMHSNGEHGLTFYPNGYRPQLVGQVLLNHTRSYRNVGDGILLQDVSYITVNGGIYSDNRVGIEIESGCESISIQNAEISGLSNTYHNQSSMFLTSVTDATVGIDSDVLVTLHCPAFRPLVGIQIHPYLKKIRSGGIHVENIIFNGYDERKNGCLGSASIDIDPSSINSKGIYTSHVTLKSIVYEEQDPPSSAKSSRVNLCNAEKYGHIVNIAIEDVTGDVIAVGGSGGGGGNTPGSIVSNNTLATSAFVANEEECVPLHGACALYCPNLCHRTLYLSMPAMEEYENLVLGISNDYETSATTTMTYPSKMDTNKKWENGEWVIDDYKMSIYSKRRYITATLPPTLGLYALEFKVDDGTTITQALWPTFVEYFWGDAPLSPFCSTEDDVVNDAEIIMEPPLPPDIDYCSELIKNGDTESGGTSGYNPWVHVGGGIQSLPNSGYVGSKAIGSVNRRNSFHGLGQFIDTRCFIGGMEYLVSAKFKLVSVNDGTPVICNPSSQQEDSTQDIDICPRASLQLRTSRNDHERGEENVDVSYAYPIAETVGTYNSGYDVSGGDDVWFTLHGVFDVGPTIESADVVLFFIDHVAPGVNIILDDVSITETSHTCQSPILQNHDFEFGDTRYWYLHGWGSMEIVHPGADYGSSPSSAIKVSNRQSWWTSVAQDINTACVVEGDSVKISAKIKLLKSDTNGAYVCDPTLVWGQALTGTCPKLSLNATVGDTYEEMDVGSIVGSYTPGEWNLMAGTFTWTSKHVNADRLMLFFQKFEKDNVDLYVDDVVIEPTLSSFNCSQLVRNGNAEAGDSRYWISYGGAQVDIYEIGGADGTSHALMTSGRKKEKSGIGQILDSSCLKLNYVYHLSAKVRLLNSTGYDFNCNPIVTYGPTRCPVASISSHHPAGPPQLHTIAAVADTTWVANDWNLIEGYFQFFENEVNATSSVIMLVFEQAPPGVIILVDEITIEQVAEAGR